MNDAAVYHPQPNEHGEPVLIGSPSLPTAVATWLDPAQVATVIPLGALPPILSGVPFAPWIDVPATHAEWAAVAGRADIAEPVFELLPSRSPAAGVVIVEDDGRVWAVSPSNRFGGYDTTFPKGRVDPGVNLQATAIREAFEESGLRVKILAHLGAPDRRQSCADGVGEPGGASDTARSPAQAAVQSQRPGRHRCAGALAGALGRNDFLAHVHFSHKPLPI